MDRARREDHEVPRSSAVAARFGPVSPDRCEVAPAEAEPSASAQVLVFGRFELDEGARELRLDGRSVAIQPKPFELLAYLVRHRARACSKRELFDQIWPEVFVSESALFSALRDLRRALRRGSPRREYIRTVYGYGYRFAAAVTLGSSVLEVVGATPRCEGSCAGESASARVELRRQGALRTSGAGDAPFSVRLLSRAAERCAGRGDWVRAEALLTDALAIVSRLGRAVPTRSHPDGGLVRVSAAGPPDPAAASARSIRGRTGSRG